MVMLVHRGKFLGYFFSLKTSKDRAEEVAKEELGRTQKVDEQMDGTKDDGVISWTFYGAGTRISSFSADNSKWEPGVPR